MTPQDKPESEKVDVAPESFYGLQVERDQLRAKVETLEKSNVRVMNFLADVFEQVNPPLSDKVWDEIKRLKEVQTYVSPN
jgi:hypothetical protein